MGEGRWEDGEGKKGERMRNRNVREGRRRGMGRGRTCDGFMYTEHIQCTETNLMFY